VVAVDVLLAGLVSVVAVAAVAVSLITVPLAVLLFTLMTNWNTAVSLAVTVAFEKTTLPVPPTAGADVLQPVPVVTDAETNVQLAGTPSVTVTVCASLGPALLKLTV
jgi:hypothetical protein